MKIVLEYTHWQLLVRYIADAQGLLSVTQGRDADDARRLASIEADLDAAIALLAGNDPFEVSYDEHKQRYERVEIGPAAQHED